MGRGGIDKSSHSSSGHSGRGHSSSGHRPSNSSKSAPSGHSHDSDFELDTGEANGSFVLGLMMTLPLLAVMGIVYLCQYMYESHGVLAMLGTIAAALAVITVIILCIRHKWKKEDELEAQKQQLQNQRESDDK